MSYGVAAFLLIGLWVVLTFHEVIGAQLMIAGALLIMGLVAAFLGAIAAAVILVPAHFMQQAGRPEDAKNWMIASTTRNAVTTGVGVLSKWSEAKRQRAKFH